MFRYQKHMIHELVILTVGYSLGGLLLMVFVLAFLFGVTQAIGV